MSAKLLNLILKDQNSYNKDVLEALFITNKNLFSQCNFSLKEFISCDYDYTYNIMVDGLNYLKIAKLYSEKNNLKTSIVADFDSKIKDLENLYKKHKFNIPNKTLIKDKLFYTEHSIKANELLNILDIESKNFSLIFNFDKIIEKFNKTNNIETNSYFYLIVGKMILYEAGDCFIDETASRIAKKFFEDYTKQLINLDKILTKSDTYFKNEIYNSLNIIASKNSNNDQILKLFKQTSTDKEVSICFSIVKDSIRSDFNLIDKSILGELSLDFIGKLNGTQKNEMRKVVLAGIGELLQNYKDSILKSDDRDERKKKIANIFSGPEVSLSDDMMDEISMIRKTPGYLFFKKIISYSGELNINKSDITHLFKSEYRYHELCAKGYLFQDYIPHTSRVSSYVDYIDEFKAVLQSRNYNPLHTTTPLSIIENSLIGRRIETKVLPNKTSPEISSRKIKI